MDLSCETTSIPKFSAYTTNYRGKNLYAAFLQLYSVNMQHYAANFFLDEHPFQIDLSCETTPIPKFLAYTTDCKGKNLYAAF